MSRALELARLGMGQVSPNPMVGCVIVYDSVIIGEGWHQIYGKEHAEVNAINSVKDKSLLSESTAYVTLEPCSHFGKTPPCVDLLIKERIARVFVCNQDPNPSVNGKGIQKLKDAKIDVHTGLLEEHGRELNKRFFKVQEKKQPYIILKWAESADNFVALNDGKPTKISGLYAQMHSHKLRADEDALLVGSQTIINDDPTLSIRNWSGRNPIRLALFPTFKSNISLNILDDTAKTIVFSRSDCISKNNIEHIRLDESISVVKQILDALTERNIQSLVVEGGPRLHQLFIDADAYDEIRLFKSKKLVLSQGLSAVQMPFNLVETLNLDLKTDYLRIFLRQFQPN
ncbi:MAG: diaminohydroxyphosphoribosylaminopyrimidine deaminase [Algoriphagus sp.]|jgi:diaminohydroxyphosphoribosylaminopyrimidine deaminase/5-amino-6-(5-phosphoribosylamino)uracil reductase